MTAIVERTLEDMEGLLQSYPKWKQKIQSIQVQLSHIPGLVKRLEQVAIHGKGQKNESVLNEVIKRLQLREEELPFWETRVNILEDAIERLEPEDQDFVELKYNEHLNNKQMMDRFHLSQSVFFRKRQEILKQLFDEVGKENSAVWLEYDRES